MKKLTTTLIAAFAAVSVMAQTTTIWTGENQTLGTQGGCWSDGSPVVVENPDKNGINASDRCLKFTMTDNNNKTMKMPFKDWIHPTLTGRQRLTMMVRKSGNCNIRIELADDTHNIHQFVAAWYGSDGAWQKLVFDFSGNGAIEYPEILAVMQTDDVNSTTDVYVDNVLIEEPWVNGTPLDQVGFGSLSGAITLTGLWAKGDCQNTNDISNWGAVVYDDFELLASKLSSRTTSVDMRGASVIKAYNVFAGVNPNTIIYANEWLDNTVPVSDAINTTSFVLTPEYGSMPTYFTPQTGYVGDVMPYYDSHAGEFKIAYLQDYRPNPQCFHPIHMVSSTDLSEFSHKGEILSCSDYNSQEAALGTGCLFYDDAKGKYYAFYTGERLNGDYSDDKRKQEIFKATSDDGVNWTKAGWVMKAPEGYHRQEFRDPQIYKEGGTYHMLLTAMKWNGSANNPVIAHFTTTDLDGAWTLQDPFFTLTDRTSEGDMMECPDLIKIGDTYYIIYSDQRDKVVRYVYSSSLGNSWTPGGVLDGNNWSLYAGKTAHYTDGTYDDYYLFGWDSTTEDKSIYVWDWGGSLITHKLYAEAPGKLALTVPHKFKDKFASRADLPMLNQTGTVSTSGSKYTLGANGRVQFARLKRANRLELNFKANSNTTEVFGFSVRDYSDNNDTRYSFRFNLANQKLYLNKDVNGGAVTEMSQVPLPRTTDGVYKLDVYQEQSVIVIYVNDKIAFTNRIYNMARNTWSVFCESGTVEVEAPKTWSY